jgi:hypothetical protein
MEPIETAADLYREIKTRGLHLRAENGRDNALLQELARKLGCPDDQLQQYLDASDLPAEALLSEFLQLAAPFARMFKEIWDYLSRNCAPKAAETISVRFGFRSDQDQRALDLEQFRRYVEASERVVAWVTSQQWPDEALKGLFGVGAKALGSGRDQTWRPYDQQGRYRPGKPYDLPGVGGGSHPFDEVVRRVRDVFQQIIDGYVVEKEQEERKERRLPEIIEESGRPERGPSLERSAYLLTDLLPTWFYLMVRHDGIGRESKDAALREFDATVRPLLRPGTSVAAVPVLEALDVLDLPFWRHRWHAYEVWASVLTLRSLWDYRPAIRADGGHVPLDGYAAAVVADLKAQSCDSACVAVQVETPFHQGKRRAIKPDLRICFADPSPSANTAAVVEFKQRSRIDGKSLAEMARAYSDGCPRSGGVLILNYDATGSSTPLPPGCYFIEEVHPLNQAGIRLFQTRLSEILQAARFEPPHGNVVVLLDVSASMGDTYHNESVQRSLKQLLQMSWVKILRFNNGLVSGGDLDPLSAQNLATSGGTQLGRALIDLESLFGLPEALLIVTDGGHDQPTDILKRIPRVRECSPAEMGDNLAWLD